MGLAVGIGISFLAMCMRESCRACGEVDSERCSRQGKGRGREAGRMKSVALVRMTGCVAGDAATWHTGTAMDQRLDVRWTGKGSRFSIC